MSANELPAELLTVFKRHLFLNRQSVCEVCIFRLRYLSIYLRDKYIGSIKFKKNKWCFCLWFHFILRTNFKVWIYFYTGPRAWHPPGVLKASPEIGGGLLLVDDNLLKLEESCLSQGDHLPPTIPFLLASASCTDSHSFSRSHGDTVFILQLTVNDYCSGQWQLWLKSLRHSLVGQEPELTEVVRPIVNSDSSVHGLGSWAE